MKIKLFLGLSLFSVVYWFWFYISEAKNTDKIIIRKAGRFNPDTIFSDSIINISVWKIIQFKDTIKFKGIYKNRIIHINFKVCKTYARRKNKIQKKGHKH